MRRDGGGIACAPLTRAGALPVEGALVLPHAALAALAGATAIVVTRRGYTALVHGRVVDVPTDGDAAAEPGVADAVAITEDCALRATGAVVCWGDRNTGQPRTLRADRPVAVVGVAGVAAAQ